MVQKQVTLFVTCLKTITRIMLVFLEGVPDAAKHMQLEQGDGKVEDDYGAQDYRSQLSLKPDHMSRPLWVVRLQF